MRYLLEFATSLQTDRHEEKKGGSPDENPRFEKIINCLIKYFVENRLDDFFLVTNAPDCSAFNNVERRMVKHSKELGGVILKHDKFGSHLDAKSVTVDKDLQLKTFSMPDIHLLKSGLAL